MRFRLAIAALAVVAALLTLNEWSQAQRSRDAATRPVPPASSGPPAGPGYPLPGGAGSGGPTASASPSGPPASSGAYPAPALTPSGATPIGRMVPPDPGAYPAPASPSARPAGP